MTTIIDKLEKAQLRKVPSFDSGDRVRVHFQVVEGTRRRTQIFEGVVIKRQGSGVRETFTVRKQSFGVGVERTFPLHSTKIEKIEVAARGEVRRAKLYYLRDRVGKRARVRERQWSPQEQAKLDAEMAGAYDDKGTQAEADLAAASAGDNVDQAAGAPPEATAEDSSPIATSADTPVAADAPADAPPGGESAAADAADKAPDVDGDTTTADAADKGPEAEAEAGVDEAVAGETPESADADADADTGDADAKSDDPDS